MTASISPLVRKLAAAGLALALALALLGLLVEPAIRRVSQLESEIVIHRQMLGRLGALAGASQEAGAAAARAEQVLVDTIYLPGTTEAIRLANLQTHFRVISERENVRAQAMRTLPTSQRDGLQTLGIQVSLQTGIEELHRLLRHVETHKPALVVDGLAISPMRGALPGTPEERQLQIELRVIAFVPASSKGKEP